MTTKQTIEVCPICKGKKHVTIFDMPIIVTCSACSGTGVITEKHYINLLKNFITFEQKKVTL